jgi:hypothetical protein
MNFKEQTYELTEFTPDLQHKKVDHGTSPLNYSGRDAIYSIWSWDVVRKVRTGYLARIQEK